MKQTRYELKKDYIIKRILSNGDVNTLDAYFVDDYCDEFNIKQKRQFYGAGQCSDLTRTLKKMFDEGILHRWANGLDPGMSCMGFPKWVWLYTLKPKHKKYYSTIFNPSETAYE